MATRRGQLYCVVRKGRLGEPALSFRTCLCRVRIDRGNTFETVRELPAGAGDFLFDQKYLYYVVRGSDPGLVARLTGDEAGGRLTQTLYRVPLQ
jgi:hypothetical protein